MKSDIISLSSLIWREGLVFDSGRFIFRDGTYFFESKRPQDCSFCSSSKFHSHGHYERNLLTIQSEELKTVLLWNRRWYCVACGHTTSITPPGLIKRYHACILVIVLILWCYLSSEWGFERCSSPPLYGIAYGKKISRYLSKAKEVSLYTQQYIREVVIERTEPGLWENLFPDGLSPPESMIQRQRRNPSPVVILWRAFAMLFHGSATLGEPCCLLLARAQERAIQHGNPFLF